MSNKREPLLSDEAVIDQTWVPELDGKNPYLAYEAGINSAKRYYERLITEGKLRVVEEVEYAKYCSKCNDKMDSQNAYCPGCGNKIKVV